MESLRKLVPVVDVLIRVGGGRRLRDYEGVETANRSRGLASKHRPVPAGVGVFVAIDGGGGGGGGVLEV